jgi:hypothetical protein
MAMPLSREKWEWVIENGTGFFAKWFKGDTYAAIRQAALESIDGAVAETEVQGADGDFIRACLLHLVELAEAHDKDRFRDTLHPKELPKVRLGKVTEGLKTVRAISKEIKSAMTPRKLKALQRKWHRAKGMINEEPTTPEENVEMAFESYSEALEIKSAPTVLSFRRRKLLEAFKRYQEFEGPVQRRNLSRGRPSPRDYEMVLVGLHRYLKKFMRQPQKILTRLIQELSLIPIVILPTKSDPESWRLLIKAYKKEKRTSGERELNVLNQQWSHLHNQVIVSA